MAAEVVPIEEFVRVEEKGADALLGENGDQLISEASDTILYGDGGASKTTLAADLALHLTAGDDCLRMTVPRCVRVLIIENEGGRGQFRKKMRRKLASWHGSGLEGRLTVLEAPWGKFSFCAKEGRAEIARQIGAGEIDALIVGPLARIGMTGAGTLAEVAEFMQHVAALRRESGRQLAVILIHHEARHGGVSGAWKGAVDTLLHAEVKHKGGTSLHIEKARWGPAHHGSRMQLNWTPGEGFEVQGKRDLRSEVERLLPGGTFMASDEVVAAVGAEAGEVRASLQKNFEMRTGEQAKALGRSPKA